jgi:hypothetical protein
VLGAENPLLHRQQRGVQVPRTQSVPQDQIPVWVTATLLAGRTSNPREMRTVTTLHPKRLVYTQASPTQLTLSGDASAQALREVEEEREGGDLWLVLADVTAMALHGTPVKFFQTVGSNLAIEVLSGQWAAELEKVTDASYAEILIPVTSDPAAFGGRRAGAEGPCPDTQRGVQRGRRRVAPGPGSGARVLPNPRHLQRGSPEGFEAADGGRAVRGVRAEPVRLAHLLYPRDEESIKGCEMDRPAANQALGAVAGLLNRLAHDHATANA